MKNNHKREFKGNNLLLCVDNYTAVDIVATGRDPNCDDIIEIALVKIRDGQKIDSYYSLINPGYPIPDFIIELKGISNDMLLSAPSIENIIHDIQLFLGDDIIVCQNAPYVINFLYDQFTDYNTEPLKNDFIDTCRLSRWLYKELPDHRLETIVSSLGLESENPGRAFSDAIDTSRCYECMKNYIKENEIDLYSLTKRKRSKNKKHRLTINDINLENVIVDTDNPFYGKYFVFTGALETFRREDAERLVAENGGYFGDSVTKKTNFLVLGDYENIKTVKGGKTRKLLKAEELILSGQDLQIISEVFFLDLLKELKGDEQDEQ